MSLSFEKGKPIGIIRKGKYKDKIVGIVDILPEEQYRIPKKMLDRDFFDKLDRKKYGRITTLDKEQIKNYIKLGVRPSGIGKNNLYGEIYDLAIDYLNGKNNREIDIVDGSIEPIPNDSGREILYVSGPSGSGKSYFTSKYANNFKKIFPKRQIVLFSKVNDDECLDKLNPLRVNIDDIEEEFNYEDFSDCLVIFDDCDTITAGNKINKYGEKINAKNIIDNLKKDILELGRHNNIYCIITSHMLTNYKETRMILNECHIMTVFIRSGSANQIKYCLEKIIGLHKDDIKKILNLPSRWVSIHKHAPQAILYSTGAYLI